MFGAPDYPVAATSTSGLAVTFTVGASSPGCTVGAAVSFNNSVGNCTVLANQSGNGDFNAASQASQSFNVGQAAQAITLTNLTSGATFTNGPGAVAATAPGGVVALSVAAASTAICSLDSSTSPANVTYLAAGSCQINATQAGNTVLLAAPPQVYTIAIGKADQTISFDNSVSASVTVGDASFNASATSTSGLTVTVSLDASSTGCSLSGTTVSFDSVGTCVIDANQGGNGNYNAATTQTASITILPLPKTDQTITLFLEGPDVTGGMFRPSATSTSNLPVTITVSDDCSINGDPVGGYVITFGDVAGTCTVFADQAGDATFNPAIEVSNHIDVVSQGNGCNSQVHTDQPKRTVNVKSKQ